MRSRCLGGLLAVWLTLPASWALCLAILRTRDWLPGRDRVPGWEPAWVLTSRLLGACALGGVSVALALAAVALAWSTYADSRSRTARAIRAGMIASTLSPIAVMFLLPREDPYTGYGFAGSFLLGSCVMSVPMAVLFVGPALLYYKRRHDG